MGRFLGCSPDVLSFSTSLPLVAFTDQQYMRETCLGRYERNLLPGQGREYTARRYDRVLSLL